MAATKVDPKAAKEAKQKKILIVLGVVLLALMAIQLPKLMGGGSEPAAAPAEATPAVGDPAAVAAPAAAPGAAVASTAPVDLATASRGARPKADESQLASFSLFVAKDPFVPRIVEKVETASPAAGAKPGKGAAGPGAGGIAVGGGNKPPAVDYAFATISVNGEPTAVTVKSEFPTDDPMFVVTGISKGQAKIGIAGGKLTNGKQATIKMGKSLTLVNDATGARYVIQLVYTGGAPEQTAEFSTAAPATTATP